MDKLAEIMAHKRREIAARIRPVALTELAELNRRPPRPPPFAAALRRPDGRLAVIGEIKRRSPSAGEIKTDASAVEQAVRYREAGVDALSVLTDQKYFGGTLDDLRNVAEHFQKPPAARSVSPRNPPGPGLSNGLPCLRKDFMVHPLQVLEAREAGASAILLIVRVLTDDEITALQAAAAAAGLEALFEIHAEAELERAVRHQAKIIGVNNRDLTAFRTDLGLSERLIPQFPPGVVAVSESGIFTGADAARARAAGAHAVLVGEALMKAENPARLVSEFRSPLPG